jgi:hypothetical protein
MKSLLPGEIKGYAVRKHAKNVVIGDIVFITWHVLLIEQVIKNDDAIELVSATESIAGIAPKTFINCIQKEDPVIQLGIEAKLEVLRKHKIISASSNNHVLIKDGVPLTTSGEWIKQGKPHQWSIMETEDKYEYWEDSAYEIKVLWAGNKIIAWNDCKKKQLSMYMLKSKEGVCVFDKPTYDLPKYIWR